MPRRPAGDTLGTQSIQITARSEEMAAIAHSTAPTSLPAARVAEAMHHGIVTLPPHCSLQEAAAEMAVNQVHCVVVEGLARGADRDERLVWGILSDMDLMRAVASGQLGVDAGELAATEILTVDPRETVERVATMMAEHDVSHVIVVSHETGEPVGVISTLDIAGALAA
jgi:CBS domain-containing protein